MGGVVSYSSNIQSLVVQRYIARAASDLNKSFSRLSSGSRINSASDDAAGLTISTTLGASARIFRQGVRNLNDGLSFLNIAQGGLTQLTDITIRLKELAEQAANGSFSVVQRRSLTTEANQLTAEFNRIVNTTSFNGRRILDGLSRSLRVQSGVGTDGSINLSVGDELVHKVGTGTYSSTGGIGGTAVDYDYADFNGDGKIDIVLANAFNTYPSIAYGNGDGTFGSPLSIGGAGASNGAAIAAADIDGDGDQDFAFGNNNQIKIFLNDGTGNFSNTSTISASSPGEIELADVTGDSILDVIAYRSGSSGVSVWAGTGGGSFSSTAVSLAASGNNVANLAIGDVDADGRNDLIVGATGGTPSASVFLSNGGGSFSSAMTFGAGGSIELGDFDSDGYLDAVRFSAGTATTYRGNGNGTFTVMSTFTVSGTGSTVGAVGDVNGDGRLDIVSGTTTTSAMTVLFGLGDGSFQINSSFATGTIGTNGALKLRDLNSDGVLDFTQIIGGGGLQMYFSSTADSTAAQYFNLSTQASARDSLSLIEGVLTRIQKELAQIGSSQSRLSTALNVTGETIVNYEASRARINDIDVASETSNMTRNQILQSTASALLSQANVMPEIALNLLKDAGI